MDGVRPTHAVRFACCWIKKGGRMEIPTNGSQRRLNILGALDLEDMAIHTQEYLIRRASAMECQLEVIEAKFSEELCVAPAS